MKIQEFKLRLTNFANNIIDSYFKSNSLSEKGMATLAKYVIKKKIDDFDDFLELFANKEKEIDVNEFVDHIVDNLVGTEGMVVNFKDYLNPDSVLYGIIPNKTLIVKKEDFNCFIRDAYKNTIS